MVLGSHPVGRIRDCRPSLLRESRTSFDAQRKSGRKKKKARENVDSPYRWTARVHDTEVPSEPERPVHVFGCRERTASSADHGSMRAAASLQLHHDLGGTESVDHNAQERFTFHNKGSTCEIDEEKFEYTAFPSETRPVAFLFLSSFTIFALILSRNKKQRKVLTCRSHRCV